MTPETFDTGTGERGGGKTVKTYPTVNETESRTFPPLSCLVVVWWSFLFSSVPIITHFRGFGPKDLAAAQIK